MKSASIGVRSLMPQSTGQATEGKMQTRHQWGRFREQRAVVIPQPVFGQWHEIIFIAARAMQQHQWQFGRICASVKVKRVV
jgi:hypothetical protein